MAAPRGAGSLPDVLRTFLERTTHRLVLKRRLPPPFAPVAFYGCPEGGLRYLWRSVAAVDAPLLELVADVVEPGGVVWDIGANLGLFTFAAAAVAGPSGHVVAVEPDGWLVRLLRRSASLPGPRAPVSVVPAAVSDRAGLADFHIAKRNRATSFLDGLGRRRAAGSGTR